MRAAVDRCHRTSKSSQSAEVWRGLVLMTIGNRRGALAYCSARVRVAKFSVGRSEPLGGAHHPAAVDHMTTFAWARQGVGGGGVLAFARKLHLNFSRRIALVLRSWKKNGNWFPRQKSDCAGGQNGWE